LFEVKAAAISPKQFTIEISKVPFPGTSIL